MRSNEGPNSGSEELLATTQAAQRLVMAVCLVYQRADDRGACGMVKFRFSVKVPLADQIREGGFEKFEKHAREALAEELEKLRGVRWWAGETMANAPENTNSVAAPTSFSRSKEDKP